MKLQWILVLPVVAVIALWSVVMAQHDNKASYYFGTLQTDPAKAQLEHEKGINVAHLPIRWDKFEPVKGRYSLDYIKGVKETLNTFKKAGSQVELGIGINHPPAWLYERHPDAAYVNQYGDRYTATPNIVFSQAVRVETESYIRGVAREIGFDNFWAVRIGVDENGEFSYPPPASAKSNDYWAYDVNAQSRGGKPETVPANPFPGWRPGQRTYGGKPFTKLEVNRWHDWYLAALSDAVNWQIKLYRSYGYHGILKVLVPGGGYYPTDLKIAINDYLDTTVADRLIGRGVGYFSSISKISHRGNIQIVSTALSDGTGKPANNGCRPQDTNVRLDSETVRDWSSTRWVANIAKRDGFPIGGESAGPQVAPYYQGVIDHTIRQMKSCGLRGMIWAFDRNLYDGTPGSSLQDYADAIARAG